jgi:hypothetical protein
MNRIFQELRERLPYGISGRLRAKNFRFIGSDVPSAVAVPSTPIRVYIGPANYAGQGYRFARAIESLPGVGAVNMQRIAGAYGFPADISASRNVFRYSRRWQRSQFEYVAENFTHVVYEAELPLFAELFSADVLAEVEALRSRGICIAMLSHGSDLRSPDLHRRRDQWSPFHDETPLTSSLSEHSRKNRALLEQLSAPVFVTTPDLLDDWPTATWIPLVVDPSRWQNESPVLERARPRVLHAPTNSWIKGSDLIEPMLLRLHNAGVIEYTRVAGVPAESMPQLYESTDIVLEQFRIGTYSVTAVEALAAGRLVIAHLFPEVRDHIEAVTGVSVPVIEATVDTLEQLILEISANRAKYQSHAALGPDFVGKVHDGHRSATVLSEFLR